MAFGQTATGQTATSTPPAASTDAKAKAPKDAKASEKPQEKPQDKAAADANASGDITTVTVTGQKPPNRIDRQVYDVSKDPDSKTGTAADALNKVPGVNVDPTGAVTVRGKDPTILVNGRPAPYLSGDNRAAALQAMPSGMINSVELMNNPGAQYGSSGPVLNLITTSTLPPGGFGSLNAQAQSTGNTSLSGFGQYHTGKISMTGVTSLSSVKPVSIGGSARRSLDANGQVLRSTESNSRQHFESQNVFSNLSVEYAFNPKDALTAQFNYTRNTNVSAYASNNVIYNPAGAATDISTSSGDSQSASENQLAGLSWNHTGGIVGETLKVDWRVSRSLSHSLSPNLSLYTLSTVASNLAGYQTLFVSSNRSNNSTFSVDYNLPIGNDQLTTGLQIAKDNNDAQGHSFGPGPASATTLSPSAFGNNQFDFSQTVSAVYATYQKPFGDHWVVLGGLRAEMFELDANAPLVSLTNHVEYTTYNPSLFATYVFSEKAKLRLSYSHRLARPGPNDYNPASVQTSETSVNVGRANLKPQETDSYETGYEYNVGRTSYQFRGYYTRETNMIISVSNFIADPLNLGNLVLRTGRENAGTRDTVGTEFNFSGKLTPKLSLNLNLGLSNVAFDSPNFGGTRSVSGLSGSNNRLSYTPNANDTYVVTYSIQPRLLNAQGQGYRTGYSTMGLQYQHKFSQNLSLTVVASDILRSTKATNYTITPTVTGYSVRSNQAPVLYVSLSRRFGGNPVMPKGGGPIIIGGSPSPASGAASPGGGGGGTVIRY